MRRDIRIATTVLVLGLGLVCLAVVFSSCGGKKLGTQISYEGSMYGDYPRSNSFVQACAAAKSCMGLADNLYQIPAIRIYSDGNGVQCGAHVYNGCYFWNGLIVVPPDVSLGIIAHECVHHWLNVDTGDMNAKHESRYFRQCGG